MKQIKITCNNFSFIADLYKTSTAEQIFNSLPLSGTVNTWGKEIYVSIPVDIPEAPNASESVDPGEIAYWPVGDAFCIFFGPTPVSNDTKPKAYSPVNIFGKISDPLDELTNITKGDRIEVTAI
jgi:hypothetical protein